MLKIFSIFIFLLALTSGVFANNTTPDLPNLPASILTKADIDAILADDTPENWEKYSQKCKEKALELASKQAYKESASWIYIHCASELFSKEGKDLNPDIKRTMLLDVPALCDLFEHL